MISSNDVTKRNNENMELKKHVATIHCSNNLSLLQRKVSNVLLFHAYSHLNTREKHKISVKTLCDYLEYKGRNYDAIKDALRALISTILEWNVVYEGKNKNKENWTASSILASVNIQEAMCTYSYSVHMRELLHFPSMYGKIDLSIQSKFKSSYGFALYENCIRYRKLRRTKVFPLKDFRKIMGVLESEYSVFRYFKKRVINKAVEEINKVSDLVVTPNIIKNRQEGISIYFDVEEKKAEIKKDIEGVEKKLKQVYLLSDEGIKKLIKKYGEDKVKEKIGQIEKTSSYISGAITNLAGFLVDVLKKDYVPTKAKRVVFDEKREQKEIEEIKSKKGKIEEDKLLQDYDKCLDNKLNDFLANLGFEERDRIEAKFREHLLKTNNVFVLKGFEKGKLANKIVRIFFRKFLKELKLYKRVFVSFEEFKKSRCSDAE